MRGLRVRKSSLRTACGAVAAALVPVLLLCNPTPALAYDYQAPINPDYGIGVVGYRRFVDIVGDEWYATEEVLGYALDHGLMTGTGGSAFSPDETLTRGQAVTVLWRIMGEPRATAEPFDDVDYDAFYGDAVAWARATGVMSGYGDSNRFGPDDPITREQLAKVVAGCASAAGVDVSGRDDLSMFVDASAISGWARPFMAWCATEGIITGSIGADGAHANPQSTASRSQFSKIASVLHRDVLGRGGATSERLEAQRQSALAANPSVVHSTPSTQDSEVVDLTGVVRRTLSMDRTLGRAVPVFYLELPGEIELVGTQYANAFSNRIILGGGDKLLSYVGKTVTLRTGILFESSASYPSSEISHMWALNGFNLVRVFE